MDDLFDLLYENVSNMINTDEDFFVTIECYNYILTKDKVVNKYQKNILTVKNYIITNQKIKYY